MRALIWLGAAGLSALTAAAFAGGLGYPLELFSHFRPHYAVAGFAGALIALLARAPLTAAFAAGLALLNAATIALALRGAPPATAPDDRALTVLFANLEYSPAALDAMAALAREEQADIVVLTELPWGGVGTARLFPALPCYDMPPTPQTIFDVVFLTPPPCRRGETSSPDIWPHAARRIMTADGATLLGTHPIPPMTAENLAIRDGVITALAQNARANGVDLVVGDFNATPWSPIMAEMRAAGLRPLDCGAPWRSTWRMRAPLLGLPIDLAYAGPRVEAARCRVGPDIGSDHFPLIIHARLAAAENALVPRRDE